MTATRDPDRTLRAWLDLVPDEAPDRVLEAVLDQIDLTPQVRRPRLAGGWRFPDMPRFLLAGAAVVLALVVGAIALVPRSSSTIAGSPSPAPSSTIGASTAPSASTVAVAGPVPAELQHRWMGGPNGLVSPGAGSSILLTSSAFALTQSSTNEQPVLTADAAAVGAGRLRLTTAGAEGRCGPGMSGTYDWTLSPSGRSLNINVADDPCADRQSALLGTWFLVGCKDPNDNCLGPVDAGTHASQFINFHQLGTGWQPAFGAVTYAVPSGWANDADWPTRLGLSPQSSFDQWTPENGKPSGLDVLADVAADSMGKPCAGQPAAGVARTPSAILATLRHIPGLVAGDSNAFSVDGHAGGWIDLSVEDAKLKPCDGGDRVVEFLISGGDGQALLPGERARVIVLADDPAPIAIVIFAPAAEFDALVPPAMRTVQSMQFK